MTRASHGRFLEMCARSALQISEPEELELLHRHLEPGCTECTAFLERLAEIGTVLAAALPVLPPAAIKQQVLDQVRVGTGPMPETDLARAPDRIKRAVPTERSRIPTLMRASLAGLTAASIGLGLYAWTARQSAQHWSDQFEAAGLELVGARSQLAELQSRFDEESRWSWQATSSGACFVRLEPTDAAPLDRFAWVVLDPGARRAQVWLRNATPPTGKVFELWSIAGGVPRSLGLMRVRESGHAYMRVEELLEADAFAVSLESEGGSTNPNAPSGPIVLLGTVRI